MSGWRWFDSTGRTEGHPDLTPRICSNVMTLALAILALAILAAVAAGAGFIAAAGG